MLLVLLTACIRLTEGDYTLDYSAVTLDSCGLYSGGQVAEDTEGEVSWDDGTLVFELDGAEDALEFEVEGPDFRRETSGLTNLDGACALATEQVDEGEMLSNTEFEGETDITGTFEGDCATWELIFDPPCLVAFEWDGESAD